jgi:hypothetical protein
MAMVLHRSHKLTGHSHNGSRAYDDPSPLDGLGRAISKRRIEVDHLAAIQARVDVADGAACPFIDMDRK